MIESNNIIPCKSICTIIPAIDGLIIGLRGYIPYGNLIIKDNDNYVEAHTKEGQSLVKDILKYEECLIVGTIGNMYIIEVLNWNYICI